MFDQVVAIKKEWTAKINARKDALVWRMLDDIILQPVIDVWYIKNNYHANDQAVRNNIWQLLEAKIRHEISVSKRNVKYESREILGILNELKNE